LGGLEHILFGAYIQQTPPDGENLRYNKILLRKPPHVPWL